MIRLYFIFISILLLSTKNFATNIAVIDINFLINNSEHFIEISNQISNSQLEFKENFKQREQNLFKSKSELEELKIILSEKEFNIKKDDYYQKVSKFENDVFDFNSHYENEIVKIKNILFTKISELIEEYASTNKIDLIIDKNQYLLAADKINLNSIMITKLNESSIDLKYEKYEN